MFREGVEHRRVVVPATWFYEWNRNKEKNIFYRKEQPVILWLESITAIKARTDL